MSGQTPNNAMHLTRFEATPPAFRFSPRPNRAHEIRWLEWGEEAFRRAREEDKPILLSLSAVWCHWCHVMDETSYSDEQVIEGLNRDYVPVRVDNDRRPDINQRYNMGGWPSTVFLTPEGEVLAGATYVPPEQMRALVAEVAGYLRDNRDEIDRRAAEALARRRAAAPPERGPLSHEIVDGVVREVAALYDPLHGGFGDQPKFPQTDSLELLLLSFQRSGDRDHLHMVRRTAAAMAGGGMADGVWGGFFRYSTERDWSAPHFEKMLEDQARLLRVYLKLYRATGDGAALATIGRTIDYVDAWLGDAATGAFYGSQDADEAFYALPANERAKRPPPYVDQTLYTGWNAAMIGAYFEASWTLGRPALAERAALALDFLFDRMGAPGGGLYRAMPLPAGAPSVAGLLADQVEAAHAALDACETLGRSLDLERALGLAELLRARFQDGADGAFFDLWDAAPPEGKLAERERTLDGNARAAELFTRLYWLTHDGAFRRTAEAALAAFATTYHHYGNLAAGYGRAVDCFLHEPAVVSVVGRVDSAATAALREAALRIDLPFRAVQSLDPARDGARLGALSLPPEPAPAAYACVGTLCSAPVADPAELARTVEAMAQAAAPTHQH